MSPRISLALAPAALVFVFAFLLARAAHASPVSEEQHAFLVPGSETSDAWLHDHCAFRGLVDPSAHNASIAGQVLELVAEGKVPLVKEFRCAERPTFLKGDFTPAAPEAVSCTEPKDPKKEVICTPALRPPPPPPPPPPPVVAPAPPQPAVVAETPPPPPPKKKSKAKKKRT